MKKIALLIYSGLVLLACKTEAPQLPEAVASWQDYVRTDHGYALKVPSYFSIEKDEAGARFRYDGHPSISVSYSTEGEADSRGLWPGHELVEEVEFNNRSWNKYIYRHSDGPFYMRVVSFVTELDDKYLAVEFRIDGDLQIVHREILESISFTK